MIFKLFNQLIQTLISECKDTQANLRNIIKKVSKNMLYNIKTADNSQHTLLYF
jgi:uncharacterized protein YpuA (DUF1002 family)